LLQYRIDCCQRRAIADVSEPNICSAPRASETPRFIASLPSSDGTKGYWQTLPLSKIRYNQMEESQQHFNL
jgi:hypothetical protein